MTIMMKYLSRMTYHKQTPMKSDTVDWIDPTVQEAIGVESPVQDMMQLWRSNFSPSCLFWV